ncbi:MAG: O-antigen ligase family protein [Acidobacteriota bacterium]|jgi:tetratricopeptide (TPR) repeat protein
MVPRHSADPLPSRLADTLAWLAALALVLLVPLLWSTAAEETFRAPKAHLALLLWTVLAAAFTVRAPGAAWRDGWWLAWAGVLAGGAMSAAFNTQPLRVAGALIPLALTALGWGALRQLPEARRRTLLRAVCLAGAVQAILTMLFLSRVWRPRSFGLLAELGQLQERFAWVGTMGNPGDVAVFLVLPALLAAQRALSGRRRWGWGAAALLQVGVIVGTRTLTALLALAAGATLLAWRQLPRRRRLPALAAAAAALVPLVTLTPLRERIAVNVREVREYGWAGLGSFRGAGMGAAVGMLAAYPIAGVGAGMFEAHSFRFVPERTLAERGRYLGLETAFGEAHNDVLQYAAETGLVGLALAAAGMALAWRRRPRGRGVMGDVPPLAAAAAVLALTQFPLHLAAVAAQWTVVAALALPPLPAPRRETAGRAWAGLIVVLVCLGIAGGLVWQRWRAGVTLQQARLLTQALRATATPAARAEASRRALERVEERLRWQPYSWRGHVIAGNLAVDAGRLEVALAHFAAALRLAERPEIRFNVGLALFLAGEQETGLAHLVQAVKLNPAVLKEIAAGDLRRRLLQRLAADGYTQRYPWVAEE